MMTGVSDSTRLLFSVLLATSFFPTIGHGDILWLRNGDVRFGRIVDVGKQEILWLPWKEDQFGDSELIFKERIERWHDNYDEKRLKLLGKNSARRTLAYAEELALQRTDPTAHRLARRLAWIAACRAIERNAENENVAKTALLLLRDLENEPVRRRRIELYLAIHFATELPTAGRSAIDQISYSSTQRQRMLELVRAIRQQHGQRALAMLASDDIDSVLAPWSRQVSDKDLDQLARSVPDPSQMRTLLGIELELMAGGLKAEINRWDTKQTWAEQASQPSTHAVIPPSLRSLSEFQWIEGFEVGRMDY